MATTQEDRDIEVDYLIEMERLGNTLEVLAHISRLQHITEDRNMPVDEIISTARDLIKWAKRVREQGEYKWQPKTE